MDARVKPAHDAGVFGRAPFRFIVHPYTVGCRRRIPMATADKLPDGIVRAAIHPSIGIARVGNSPDGCFYGPEVTDPLPDPAGFYRDGSGALKRQSARFRVYGVDVNGKALAELTAANADIVWTVQLANKKAAWYEFQLAQDIPEALSAPEQM